MNKETFSTAYEPLVLRIVTTPRARSGRRDENPRPRFSRLWHSVTTWTMRLKLDYYSGNNATDDFCLTCIRFSRMYMYTHIYLDSIIWHPTGRNRRLQYREKQSWGSDPSPRGPDCGLDEKEERQYEPLLRRLVFLLLSSRNWKHVTNHNAEAALFPYCLRKCNNFIFQVDILTASTLSVPMK